MIQITGTFTLVPFQASSTFDSSQLNPLTALLEIEDYVCSMAFGEPQANKPGLYHIVETAQKALGPLAQHRDCKKDWNLDD